MTKQKLIIELKKYLKDEEFLTNKGNISKIKLETKVSKLPYDLVKDIISQMHLNCLNWQHISSTQILSEDFRNALDIRG